MASNISAPVVQGVFALEVTVTVLALLLTLLTTTLALLLFLRRSSRHRSNRTSPKGTFAFLFPGALCLTIAQAATAASVALQANSPSPISITHAFSLHHTGSNNKNASRTSTNLSFLSAFASILSTTSLNGAVWLHASHATSNGLAVGQPSRLSIAANTLLLSSMLGTGFASWGLAIAAEKPHERYGSVLQNDTTTAILYTVFRACVVGASASVSVEAVRRFVQVKKHSSRDASERPILARLALLAVPLILLRAIFILLDVALLWTQHSQSEGEQQWSHTTQDAVAFLLIVFGPYAELWVFALVCWGGWSMSRRVRKDGGVKNVI